MLPIASPTRAFVPRSSSLTARSLRVRCRASSSSVDQPRATPVVVVVYTTKSCALCDGLVTKLRDIARDASTSSALRDMKVETRDCASDGRLEASYASRAPVVRVRVDGRREIAFARPTPKASRVAIAKNLESALIRARAIDDEESDGEGEEEEARATYVVANAPPEMNARW